jgi:hypothetical protein
MKCVVEMSSGGKICITNFVKNGSFIQMLIGMDTHTDTCTDSKVISVAYFYFFKIRK